MVDPFNVDAFSFKIPSFRRDNPGRKANSAKYMDIPIKASGTKSITNQDLSSETEIGENVGASIPNEIFNLVKV